MKNVSLPAVAKTFEDTWSERDTLCRKIGSKITVAELVSKDGETSVHAGYNCGWEIYAGEVVTAGTPRPLWVRRVGSYWPGDETMDRATSPNGYLNW